MLKQQTQYDENSGETMQNERRGYRGLTRRALIVQHVAFLCLDFRKIEAGSSCAIGFLENAEEQSDASVLFTGFLNGSNRFKNCRNGGKVVRAKYGITGAVDRSVRVKHSAFSVRRRNCIHVRAE